MFLDRILRPAEVKEFEATLKPHQLATIAQSSNDRLAAFVSDSTADDGPGAAVCETVSTRKVCIVYRDYCHATDDVLCSQVQQIATL